MESQYEKMGVVLSHVGRAAVVRAIHEEGPLAIPDLEREANKRLSVIGRVLGKGTTLEEHLRVLDEERILHDSDGQWGLTPEGTRIAKRLISG